MAVHIVPHRPAIQRIPTGRFPHSIGLAHADEIMAVADIAALPEEATAERGSFSSFGVRSVLQVPIRVDGRTIGLVGFNSFERTAEWNDDLIRAARRVGQAIGVALVRQRAAHDIRVAWREAERANRAKDDLLASVSHELRTPLTVVLGTLEELGSGDVDEVMVGELVDMAASQAREMSYIVEDLLVEARAGIGGVSIQIGPVDVRTTAVAVVRELALEMSVVGLEGGGVFAAGDPVRVRQILRNLVMNANRYGGTDRRLVIADRGDMVSFEMRDSGDRLPDAISQRIFEPYQRAHHGEGSPVSIGLGLAVSRQLAGLMGGDVRYDHDGESVFSLVLPKWEESDSIGTDGLEPAPAEGVAQ